MLCGYFGAFIVGSVFLAVSCLCSAISKSQTASYLLSLGICSALVFSGWDRVTEILTLYLPDFLCKLISYCAVIPHYQSFQRGILDSSEVFYGIAMTCLFLFGPRAVLLYSVSGAGSIFNKGTLSDSYTWKQIGIMIGAFIIGLYGFFCFTYFTNTFHAVIDCTEDRAFSLTPLSRSVAADLNKRITIRFYTSPSGGNMPKEYQLYSARIRWLLQRFAEQADGMVRLQVIQPE